MQSCVMREEKFEGQWWKSSKKEIVERTREKTGIDLTLRQEENMVLERGSETLTGCPSQVKCSVGFLGPTLDICIQQVLGT